MLNLSLDEPLENGGKVSVSNENLLQENEKNRDRLLDEFCFDELGTLEFGDVVTSTGIKPKSILKSPTLNFEESYIEGWWGGSPNSQDPFNNDIWNTHVGLKRDREECDDNEN